MQVKHHLDVGPIVVFRSVARCLGAAPDQGGNNVTFVIGSQEQ